MPGASPTRPRCTRARSSSSPSRASSTSSSRRPTSRSSATRRTTSGASSRCERSRASPRRHEALFCAMTTVHSADPPRHFQELARELDVPLLRGPRDAMLALANVARAAPVRSDRRPPPRSPDLSRPPRAARARSPSTSRRSSSSASAFRSRQRRPRSDAGRGGRSGDGDRSPGRRQVGRPRAQGAQREASCSASRPRTRPPQQPRAVSAARCSSRVRSSPVPRCSAG